MLSFAACPCRTPLRSAVLTTSIRSLPGSRRTTERGEHSTLLHHLAQAACTVALAVTLVLAPASAVAASELSNTAPVTDLAHVIPAGKLDAVQEQLLSLERDTGWRVRVLTRFGAEGPSIEEIRRGWNVDGRTVVVLVDPSSPNIMSFKWGKDVQKLLPRPFFTELQSRFGNMFHVREFGEAAAVGGAVDGLVTCLRRDGGCAVVPGLSSDQYFFTLLTSVAGGAILGSVLRIDPVGFVKRRWVWGAIFFPLWGTLAINFGLGPLLSRTDDPVPVVGNLAACAVVALLIYNYQKASNALFSQDKQNWM